MPFNPPSPMTMEFIDSLREEASRRIESRRSCDKWMGEPCSYHVFSVTSIERDIDAALVVWWRENGL